MCNLTIKEMKKVILMFIVSTMLYSCWRECPSRVDNMQLYPVINTKTNEHSTIEGWYHSEFQDGLLNFSIEFGHYGAGEFCNYYWANYPDEQSIKIACNRDVYTANSDTIKAGELLNSCFSITKFEKNFFISFLISEKPMSNYTFNEQYYTFFATIETAKNEIFEDSCIVKRF